MTLKPAYLQWSDDGAVRSLDYGDIYFQRKESAAESHYVFLEKNDLPRRFTAPPGGAFRVGELGFGSGLNFLLTAALWQKTAPGDARLVYAGIEKHPIKKDALARIFSRWPELGDFSAPLLDQYPPLIEGFHHLHFLDGRIRLMLLLGDVTDMLPELGGTFDAWYLDGFSPSKNPAMWEDNIFAQLAARTAPGGTLSTFSSAGSVRRGLEAAGFAAEKIAGFGVKRDMTVAKFPGTPVTASKKSVTVLGAGIAGASVAYAFAQKGYKVTVIDRQKHAAAETSGNPVGIVYPKMTVDASPLGLFHQHGFCFTRTLVTALKLKSWNPCGVLHLDVSGDDMKRHKTLGNQGYPEDYLVYKDGLYQPPAGHLSPAELCETLLDHPNIETRFETEISALEQIETDITVIALGNASKSFRETEWLPLQPVRGQISIVKQNTVSGNLKNVICHDGYITPAMNGFHCIGATFQKENVTTPELRETDHAENLARLNTHLPKLKFTIDDVIDGRTGYRATTPDHLPIAGAAPDYSSFVDGDGKTIPDLYLCTGFGAHGLSGAPLCGEIIAAQISGDPLPIPQTLLPYVQPERFILRDLKRKKFPHR